MWSLLAQIAITLPIKRLMILKSFGKPLFGSDNDDEGFSFGTYFWFFFAILHVMSLCETKNAPSSTRLSSTGLSSTRFSSTRLSLTRLSLTRFSLTKLSLIRLSLTRLSLTRLSLTRFSLTRLSLTRLDQFDKA